MVNLKPLGWQFLGPKIKNTGLVEGNFYASQIAETILNMSKGIDTKIPIE